MVISAGYLLYIDINTPPPRPVTATWLTPYSGVQRGSRAGSRLSCSGHKGSSSVRQSLMHFREQNKRFLLFNWFIYLSWKLISLLKTKDTDCVYTPTKRPFIDTAYANQPFLITLYSNRSIFWLILWFYSFYAVCDTQLPNCTLLCTV